MKKLTLLHLFVMAAFYINAQSNFGVTGSQSDINSGSSGANQENSIGMDLFHGTASIGIPIVKKTIDGLSFGISLVYSTSGIKLNDVASNVGLGWNLTYGGGISRVVKGIPDEFCLCNGTPSASGLFMGFWHRSNSDILVNSGIPKDITNLDAQLSIASGHRDGQLDQFYLNINGMNAEFIITDQNQIQISPANGRIQIERTFGGVVSEPLNPGTNYAEMGFKITDESGNVYYLESTSKQKAHIIDYNGQPYTQTEEYYTTSWSLTKIITKNNKEILFDYSAFENSSYLTDKVEEITNVDPMNQCYPHFTSQDISTNTKSKRLTSIHFPDIDVNIIYHSISRIDIDATNRKPVYEIDVIEKENLSTHGNPPTNGSIVSKKIRLDLSYFSVDGKKPYGQAYSGQSFSFLDYRLRLDGIKSVLPNGSTKMLYSFDYVDIFSPGGHPQDIPLDPQWQDTWPYRLNSCQDYWGYYNGNQSSGGIYGTMVPMYNFPTFGINGGIDRTANSKNKLFSLRAITNERMLRTELTYEMNSALVNGNSMNLDGPRLKETVSYTVGMDNVAKNRTVYVYENAEWLVPKLSSGSQPLIADLFKRKINIICPGPGPGPSSPITWTDVDVISNKFVGQLEAVQHGYGKVTTEQRKIYKEKSGSGSINTVDELLGKEVVYYSNYYNNPSTIISQIGSTTSGVSYNLNTSNLTLPRPSPSVTFSGTTLVPGGNYFLDYNSFPYTLKNYSNSLALGMQYKSESFDAFGNKRAESNQKINTYVKALNTNEFLNLNASSKTIDATSTSLTPDPTWLNLDYYFPFTGYVELVENEAKSYINNTQFITKKLEYTYDPVFNRPKVTKETFPNGDQVENREFYAFENSNWNNSLLNTLDQKDRNKIVYSEVWKKKSGGTWKLFNASGSGFGIFNGQVREKFHYSIKGSSPLSSSPLTTNSFSFSDANSGITIPNFERGGEVLQYDEFGNVIEQELKGIRSSFIYETYQNLPIAVVSNASFDKVAYSSFEANQYPTDPLKWEVNKGNWRFNPTAIEFDKGMTGNRCYKLGKSVTEDGQSVLSSITSGNNISFEPGKKYILSFWRKLSNGDVILVETFNQGGTHSEIITPYRTITSSVPKLNGWTYCEVLIDASTYLKVRIHGVGLIDEVRLHPYNASMVTSFETTLGGKLFECDGFNNIIHYEYDPINRIRIARDIQGNILSKTKSAVQEIE